MAGSLRSADKCNSHTVFMSATNTAPDFPHKLNLWQKLRVSARKRLFGRKHAPDNRRKVRCRYNGADFIVNLEDVVGYEIAINRYEWRELKIMLDACRRRRPQLFLDVGANIGLYSCVLARNNAVPRVVAFEPDRDNRAHMAMNVELNGLADRIELHEVAVGAARGTAHLVPSAAANRGMSHLTERETAGGYGVPVVSLDDTVRLDGATIVIKIDVEGHELEVLKGAAQLLARNNGFAQIEGRTDHLAGVISELMETFGWRFVERYGIDLRFEKP